MLRSETIIDSATTLLLCLLLSSGGCAKEHGPSGVTTITPAPVRRAPDAQRGSAGSPTVRPAAPHKVPTPPADGAAPDSAGRDTPQNALLSPELERPAVSHLVALGDMHGDLSAARRALRLAGAIDEHDRWGGGSLTLVQTGDVLDRGDDDRAILDLLFALQPQAAEAGGQLLLLAGNHELMNVQLNFSYVTPGGYGAFGGQDARAQAFRPGGPYAQKLAALPIMLKVGDTLFVHGGILLPHVGYGLPRMNDEVQRWMRGELFELPAIVNAGDGLLWTRLYSSSTDERACEQLGHVLKALGAKRMVVGHTPQLEGVTSACDERVWRIDVGMSRFYGGPVQALRIDGDRVSILREP